MKPVARKILGNISGNAAELGACYRQNKLRSRLLIWLGRRVVWGLDDVATRALEEQLK